MIPSKLKFSKRFGKSFRFKVYLNFLAVSAITIIIMNFVSFQYFDYYMKNQIKAMSRTKLENISTVYNNKLDQHRRFTEMIYNMPKCISYFYSSGNASALDAIDISNTLRPILNTDEAANSIFLFNKDKIIYELDIYYMDLSIKQQILSQVLETISDRYPLLVNLKDGSKRLVFFRTDREKLFGKSQSGVVVVIDPEKLKINILSDYQSHSDEILIVDNSKSNVLISQNGKHGLDNAALKEITFSGKLYDNYTNKINNDYYIISYISNPAENYSVVSLIDYQSSIKELLRARNIMILFTIAVILLALLLSYYFTKRTYKPINNILASIQTAFKKNEQDEGLYDEFQKASLAITRAVDEFNLLETKYNNSEILEYLRNSGVPVELPKELKCLEKKLGGFYQYRVISVEIESALTNTDISACTEALNFSKLISISCKQTFSEIEDQLFINMYNIKLDQVILILSENQASGQLNNPGQLGIFLRALVDNITSAHNIAVYMGLSGLSNDMSRLTEHFQESHNLVKYKLFYPVNSYLIADTFSPLKLDKSKAEEISESILESLKGGNMQSLPDSYTKVILKVVENVEYNQSLEFVTNLITDANNLSQNLSKESKEYRRSYLDIYLKVQSCNNSNELSSLIENMFNSANLEIKIARSKTVQINIIDSLKYINDHIGDRSLSIDLLADQCNISTSYFSKLFNSYTKKTFPDYVNNLRLEKAAEMLINNKDVDINEISDKVGFNSSSYFASAFRKKYGISPSKYRINYFNTAEKSLPDK